MGIRANNPMAGHPGLVACFIVELGGLKGRDTARVHASSLRNLADFPRYSFRLGVRVWTDVSHSISETELTSGVKVEDQWASHPQTPCLPRRIEGAHTLYVASNSIHIPTTLH